MYVSQQCFGLPDEGMEDAIYDSQAIRRFIGIDISHERTPDATTLLKFRRLLETHELTKKLFDTINEHLASKGLLIGEGTIVDATLIAAPPSTKNKDKSRDPDMHQSKTRRPTGMTESWPSIIIATAAVNVFVSRILGSAVASAPTALDAVAIGERDPMATASTPAVARSSDGLLGDPEGWAIGWIARHPRP